MAVRAARAQARPSAKPADPQHPNAYQTASIPAPTLGLTANSNPAVDQPGGAYLLDNFLPTATNAMLRRGSQIQLQVGDGTDDVLSLFTYLNGNNRKMFAGTDSGIYDASNQVTQEYFVDEVGGHFVDEMGNRIYPGATTNVSSLAVGVTDGNWRTVQFATAGGVFLDLVNGVDNKQIYDGTNFYPVDGTDLYAINYTAETAPFTVGKTLTGQTSTATGTIVKVIDNGTTGTLWVKAVTGTFSGTEVIKDNNTPTQGSATASGAPTLLVAAMTGIATSSLTQNWVYKSRLFYVQKDSLNAWYLPAGSITGLAVILPLGAIFTNGGSLLFGASWSLETGQGGLSEQCIFATTEGEVAVFQGSDPSVASSWTKVGVYRIGKPLGASAYFRAGGDIVIATDIGLIPLSQALQKDFAVLSPNAVSAKIENIWNQEVKDRSSAPWNCTVWSANQIAVVAPPAVNNKLPVMYAANTRTGAWGRITGWDSLCLCVFNDRMFFGSHDGRVIEANVTGLDINSPYTGSFVPLFSDFGGIGYKITGMTRVVLRSNSAPNDQLSMQSEFNVNLPANPAAAPVAAADVWNVGIWGTAKWDSTVAKSTFEYWRSTPGTGVAVAPAIQVTSGNLIPLDTEILRVDVTYQPADVSV